MEELKDFFSRLHFTWYNSRVIWTARSEGKLYVVEDEIYQRVLTKHLSDQGIERKSYCSLIRPYEEAKAAGAKNCFALLHEAEREWKRQCDAEDRVARHLELWACVPGVQVHLIREGTYATTAGHGS